MLAIFAAFAAAIATLPFLLISFIAAAADYYAYYFRCSAFSFAIFATPRLRYAAFAALFF